MAAVIEIPQCPVCHGDLAATARALPDDTYDVHCIACGPHRFTLEALQDMPGTVASERARAVVAFKLAGMPREAVVDAKLVSNLVHLDDLPAPLARIDRLLAQLADDQREGIGVELRPGPMWARLGCLNIAGARWVFEQARAQGYTVTDALRHTMTAKGWERYGELTRQGHGSTHAFMAMHYSDDMHGVFRDHLVPAVAATGFDLRTANGPQQPAGSIDDRMRVEIRTSRFLVCDISDGNRGAHWEAGFAEGLGRPVFYVCRVDVLNDPTHPHHPHFDPHSLIVPWDPADMEPGMLKLKQAIRATLPDLARMED